MDRIDGPDSPTNELLCIENCQESDIELVGDLWHSVQTNEPTTFVHDFYIHEAHRSNGFGRPAIKILEQRLLSLELMS